MVGLRLVEADRAASVGTDLRIGDVAVVGPVLPPRARPVLVRPEPDEHGGAVGLVVQGQLGLVTNRAVGLGDRNGREHRLDTADGHVAELDGVALPGDQPGTLHPVGVVELLARLTVGQVQQRHHQQGAEYRARAEQGAAYQWPAGQGGVGVAEGDGLLGGGDLLVRGPEGVTLLDGLLVRHEPLRPEDDPEPDTTHGQGERDAHGRRVVLGMLVTDEVDDHEPERPDDRDHEPERGQPLGPALGAAVDLLGMGGADAHGPLVRLGQQDR